MQAVRREVTRERSICSEDAIFCTVEVGVPSHTIRVYISFRPALPPLR
jgi:hypothetical protein